MRARRSGLRTAVGGVLILLLTMLGWGVSTPTARADEGLTEVSATRYTVAPDGAVTVTVRMTIKNIKPNQREGNSIRYFYYTSFSIPVPSTVTSVTATSGGKALTVALEGAQGMTRLARASFPELRYNKSRTIDYTYTLVGAPIRSAETTRVGKGYATFAAYGFANQGATTVEIVTPSGYDFNASADVFTSTPSGSQVVWRATEPTEEQGIWAFVTVRDPLQASEREITLGGEKVKLLSLPGDDAWTDFVDEKLTAGVPHLERLLGSPWPGGLDTVREDVAPAVTGYAWFNPTEREILIGEELDTHLLMHEASHVWLNDATLTERWMYEGLAELVAVRISSEVGGEEAPPKIPSRDGDDAFALAEWEIPQGVAATPTDEYGYAAAYAAADELLGDVDDETFAEVVSSAIDGRSAYEAPDSTLFTGKTTARRFLDLIEVVGGNDKAFEAYKTWVLNDDGVTALTARSEAREIYNALDGADGEWLVPQGLRGQMTVWEFDEAREAMKTLAPLATDAGTLQEASSTSGLSLPADVRTSYETAVDADDYREVAETVEEATASLKAVDEASRAAEENGNPFAELGESLLRTDDAVQKARSDFSAGRYAAAADGAEEVQAQLGKSGLVGGGVVAGAVLLLAAVVVTVLLLVRRSRRRAQRPQGLPLSTQTGQTYIQGGPQGQPHGPQPGPGPAGPDRAPQPGPGPGGPAPSGPQPGSQPWQQQPPNRTGPPPGSGQGQPSGPPPGWSPGQPPPPGPQAQGPWPPRPGPGGPPPTP